MSGERDVLVLRGKALVVGDLIIEELLEAIRSLLKQIEAGHRNENEWIGLASRLARANAGVQR